MLIVIFVALALPAQVACVDPYLDNDSWTDDAEEAVKWLAQAGINGSHCDFARVEASDLTVGTFETRYRHQPFLLRGAVRNWPAMKDGRFQRKALLEKLGDVPLDTHSGLDVSVFGPGPGRRSTLAEFAEQMRMNRSQHVVFDVSGHNIAKLSEKDWNAPHPLSFAHAIGPLFSMGGPAAGLPMHTHGEAWLGVVWGRKLWMSWPPDGPAAKEVYWSLGVLPLSEILRRHSMPSVNRPLLCVQNAGDVVFIPALWWHATMNLGESVGVGDQENIASLSISDIRKLSEKYPRSGRLLMMSAMNAMRNGDAKTGSELFQAAEAAEPAQWDYRRDHAEALNFLFPGQGARVIRQAVSDLSKAEKRGMVLPSDAKEVRANFAYWANHAAEYVLCAKLVATVLKNDPEHDGALTHGTRCALLAGRHSQASAIIDARLRLLQNEDNADSRYLHQLARWLKDQPDDPTKLAVAAKTLFESSPHSPQFWKFAVAVICVGVIAYGWR